MSFFKKKPFIKNNIKTELSKISETKNLNCGFIINKLAIVYISDALYIMYNNMKFLWGSALRKQLVGTGFADFHRLCLRNLRD